MNSNGFTISQVKSFVFSERRTCGRQENNSKLLPVGASCALESHKYTEVIIAV